jgi:hypothetical protein
MIAFHGPEGCRRHVQNGGMWSMSDSLIGVVALGTEKAPP